ncbi:MAG: hypothetical protein ABII88_07485 [Candidatus Omnitrophota bacterium]
MKIRPKNAVLTGKLIALMIVQGILFMDIAWACEDTLSPSLTISKNYLQEIFSATLDIRGLANAAIPEQTLKNTPLAMPDDLEMMQTFAQQLLQMQAKVLDVKFRGVVMPPKAGHDTKDFRTAECILNAGGALLGRTKRDDENKMRVLWPRIAVPRQGSELRTSFVDLVIHENPYAETGQVKTFSGEAVPIVGNIIEIQRRMLDPDDQKLIFRLPETQKLSELKIQLVQAQANNRNADELEKEIEANTVVALEDARVLERDNKVRVALTVVFGDGHYYSGETIHDTKELISNINKRREYPQAEVEWEWTPLKKLINDGPCTDDNIKNFVYFGNPAEDGKWYAIYRPDSNRSSIIRLAVSENGLDGTWRDAGVYFSTPDSAWGGGSTFISELPHGLELLLIHTARQVKEGQEKELKIRKRDYDLWAAFVKKNRDDDTEDPEGYKPVGNNPWLTYMLGPILKADKDRPYELDERSWYPGAIYSCFAVLAAPVREKGEGKYEFDVDIYYSAADTATVLATVSIAVNINGSSVAPIEVPEKFPQVSPLQHKNEEAIDGYLRKLIKADGKIDEAVLKDISALEGEKLVISDNPLEHEANITIKNKAGHRYFVIDRQGIVMERYLHQDNLRKQVRLKNLKVPQEEIFLITDQDVPNKFWISVNGKVIGVAEYSHLPIQIGDNMWDKGDIFIQEKYRVQGIGKSVNNLFAKWAKENGRVLAVFNVRSASEAHILTEILHNPTIPSGGLVTPLGAQLIESFPRDKGDFIVPISCVLGIPHPYYLSSDGKGGFSVSQRIEMRDVAAIMLSSGAVNFVGVNGASLEQKVVDQAI